MKKRILFVDDEPRVLEGLQRMLRALREEWDMAFAGSGPEALACLSQQPFDVVVSDMRMPGMDGAQLLMEVKRLSPQVARIILSGHSDPEVIMKSVRVAHQYLAKPCEAETLKSVVMRTCALRTLLADDSLKRFVSNIDSLPSLPSPYAEIIEELQSPQASTEKIGKIISKDMGMIAKILQLVNSAFFGLQRHVSNPVQAVTLLGTETIRALVLSVHIFTQFDPQTLPCLSLERLWKHSFLTAVLAKAIASGENQKQMAVDDAFMAGLLHDVGKPILVMNFRERYLEARGMALKRRISLWEAEKEVFGVTHSEVGAYLTGLWGLPDPIVEALAFHHDPAKCQAQEFSPLLAVHLANALGQEGEPSDTLAVRSQISQEYLSGLNMLSRLSLWQEACRQAIQGGKIDG